MTKIVIRLKIEETGKINQIKFLTLENTNPLIIGTDFFLSPHLSIGLPEDQPPSITFHSEEISMINNEDGTVYSYTCFNGEEMSIPKHGIEFYFLQKGSTFSITKTQKNYFKVIKAEVTLVDLTPHEEPQFPEEFHISP